MSELFSLKQSRKALKGVVTKKVNELRYVIDAGDHKDAVKLKIQELEAAFLNFEKCHSDCHSLFQNEVDIEESCEYFTEVEAKYIRATEYAEEYILVNRARDDAGSESSCGTTSSAKTRAVAKRASLIAQQAALGRKQELERDRLQLEQKQAELDIETKIAMAEAQERVYSEYEDGGNTVPKIPQARSPPRAMTPQYTAPRFKNQLPDAGDHRSFSDQEITRDLLTSINLPKLEIASFDGNPLRFWVFMRSFDNAVGSTPTSSSSKLTRLLQYCTGKALKLIQCCAVMDPTEGYHKARTPLKERFGDNFVISEAWINTVTDRPVLKPNDKSALQEFSDDLQNCRETLAAMGKLGEIDTQRSLSKIVDKLPAYLQNRWRKVATTARKRYGEYPNFSVLTEFVESAADEANDPVFGFPSYTAASTDNKGRNQHSFARRSSSSFNASVGAVEQTRMPSKQSDNGSSESKSQGQGRPCARCGGQHGLFACDEFKQMSPEERFKFTRAAKLCDNCLNPYHIAAKCYRQTVCSVPGCGKKHSKFLHVRYRPTEDKETQLKSEAANNCVTATNETCYVTGAGSSGKTALPILPINVTGQSGHIVKTYALLDSGSTNTFCSEKLVDLLGLSGRETTLSLTTLEQTNKPSRAMVVELEVSDVENKSQIKLPHVFARAKLPISTECIPVQTEISKWPHLQDIDLPEINNSEIMLLIGQDVPEALVPIEVRRGGPRDPYAVRTVLGWTLNGPIRYGDHRKAVVNFVRTDIELAHQVKRFCDLESLTNEVTDTGVLPMSVDDMKVLETWEKSVTKVNQHYQMDIPFKTRPPILPNNRHLAEQRLNSLRGRLRRDSWLADKYSEGIGDLLKKGYAECVPEKTTEQGE